ncbi:uncharacterized protein LOC115219084 [Argonauta hians]
MSQQLTGEQIISISNKVMRNVRKCNVAGVKSKLDPLKMPHRKRIASRKIHGFTALFVAVSYNNLEIVQYLLQECSAPVDQPVIFGDDDAQLTPLLVAASEHCLKMLRILLDYGADINSKDHLGNTALKMCVKGGSIEIVQFLIERGSDVNSVDHKGITPLMDSVFNLKLVELLLQNGANLYATDSRGNTVLHFAACKGNLEVFKFLVEKGFTPYTCNAVDENCFHLAASHWQWRILIYLLVTFPYPEHSPQQYFDSLTTQIFIDALEAEHNIDIFEFPALMVTEKILGTCCTSLEALGYAAWLQCDLGNVSLAWDVYCHLLRACQRMRYITGPDIVTWELDVFWKIYCKDQHYLMPFKEVITLVRQIVNDIVVNWEPHRKSNCEEESCLKKPNRINAWQTLLLFVVNLLKILIQYQHKWGSLSSQKFSCSVLDKYTKVVSPTQQLSVGQGKVIGGSILEISLRLHGKWQLMDIILQACHDTQKQFLGNYLLEIPHSIFEAAKLVPVKEPLPLQCLTARVLNKANIEFQKYLPGRLADFVLHHLS